MLDEVLDAVCDASAAPAVYVHCAVGHSRSAMFAMALMIRRGLAADRKEAERIAQAARPTIHLNRRQARFLDGVLAGSSQD